MVYSAYKVEQEMYRIDLIHKDALYPMIAKNLVVGPWGQENKHYKFQRFLGKGTFAIVYEALSLQDPQELVAIKISRIFEEMTHRNKKVYKDSSKEFARGLLEEAYILKRINNPYIVKFKGYGVTTRLLRLKEKLIPSSYLLLEKVGPSLKYLRNQSEIGINKITLYFRQTLQALDYLHSEGKITHCDLKPDNIALSLDDDSAIKVLDFSTSVHDIETLESSANRTTRWYRAPEYFLKLSLTSAIDIWALACTVIEVITNSSLFKSRKFIDHASISHHYFGMFPQEMIEKSPCYEKAFTKIDSDYKLKQESNFDPSALEAYLLPYFVIKDSEKLALYVDLLKKMFVYDPSLRVTAKEALEHPLFQNSL
jgi:serine/threonine protein kinase